MAAVDTPSAGELADKRLTGECTYCGCRDETNTLHACPQPRNEDVGEPVGDRSETHRIEAALTSDWRVERRQLRQDQTGDAHRRICSRGHALATAAIVADMEIPNPVPR